jgi:hypothetical protein
MGVGTAVDEDALGCGSLSGKSKWVGRGYGTCVPIIGKPVGRECGTCVPSVGGRVVVGDVGDGAVDTSASVS